MASTMRSARTAEQALRLAAPNPSQRYVCRACRAHAARQYHTSRALLAETKPWTQRLRDSIFGSKESRQAADQRDEKHQKRVEELATHEDAADLEIITDRKGREYEVAAYVEPSVNKDYVPATTWDGLESMGSEEWMKKRADQGEQYVG